MNTIDWQAALLSIESVHHVVQLADSNLLKRGRILVLRRSGQLILPLGVKDHASTLGFTDSVQFWLSLAVFVAVLLKLLALDDSRSIHALAVCGHECHICRCLVTDTHDP